MLKNYKIVLSIVVLILAACFLFFSMFGKSDGDSGGDGKQWFKCVNSKCKAVYSLTMDEFVNQQKQSGLWNTMMVKQQVAFVCAKCGQKNAQMAIQCEKCKEVFLLGQTSDRLHPDKCPKCGYYYLEK